MNLLNKNGKLPELDGIRGMALILVMFSHLSISEEFKVSDTGKTGVWLFFILSAFLLSSYFLAAPERSKNIWEWLNYLLRRILRVYPLYILVLLFNYHFFRLGGVNEENLANHILLNDGVAHFWTIPVELHFYLVLPFVVLIIIYVLRQNIFWTGLALAGSIGLHQLIMPPGLSKIGDFHLLTYLPVFLTGCFLATIHVKTKDIKFTRRHRFLFDGIAFAILTGILITKPNIWSALFFSVPIDYFQKDFIEYGLAWSAFLWFTINGIVVKKFFALPFFRIWGVISYSAYLIHIIVFTVVINYFGIGFGPAILDFTIIFALSLLLHILIERPSMKVNILKLRKTPASKPNEKAGGLVTSSTSTSSYPVTSPYDRSSLPGKNPL